MGFHKKELDKKCNHCGNKLVRVHLKNPFIDDFLEGCDNLSCSNYEDMHNALNSWARSEAKREESEA